MSRAARAGLRAFDATLIIAIVQDRARFGERASRGSRSLLALLSPAPASSSLLAHAIAALALGAIGAGALITWISGSS